MLHFGNGIVSGEVTSRLGRMLTFPTQIPSEDESSNKNRNKLVSRNGCGKCEIQLHPVCRRRSIDKAHYNCAREQKNAKLGRSPTGHEICKAVKYGHCQRTLS